MPNYKPLENEPTIDDNEAAILQPPRTQVHFPVNEQRIDQNETSILQPQITQVRFPANEPTVNENEASILQSQHVQIQLPANRLAQNNVANVVQNSVFHEKDAMRDSTIAIGGIDDPADVDQQQERNSLRHWLKRYVEHLVFRTFSMLLVLIDICILIADLLHTDKSHEAAHMYDTISLCFVCYFVVEVFLRIYVKGPVEFFSQWFNAVDFTIVIVAFVVTVIYTALETLTSYAKLVVAGRLVRVVLFVRLYTEHKHLKKGARRVVSENKRRYQKDGFDLDLTYVTERVIAMSFPSSGKMSLYRNPIKEVARFFNTKYEGCYKIYNLCSEKGYDVTHFFGRVERFMIDDHNVPSLREMKRFVENVGDWLSQDPKNVIAVHCKGGKGRTGTMVCAWLLQSGMFPDAEAALDYFASRRTDLNVGTKYQGVQTPSQSRYVGYFHEMRTKYGGNLPPEKQLALRQIKITALAGIGKGNGSDLTCEIVVGGALVLECDFGSNRNCQADYHSEADVLEVTVMNCPILKDDVRLKFHCSSRSVPRAYENCAFYFWFHTSFVEGYEFQLPRDQIDNCHKEKSWKLFRDKFSIKLTFSDPRHDQDIPLN